MKSPRAAGHTQPQNKMIMGSGLRGLMNGLGSTFGVSMAALFVERQQTVHAMGFAEIRVLPHRHRRGARSHAGASAARREWNMLATKTAMVLRDTMFEEAAVLAYRDCYMAMPVARCGPGAGPLFADAPTSSLISCP